MKSKRGTLNISIEAIVIVVIALTVLGLGITFVRQQITGIGTTTTTIQEQIKQQILDDLRTGNKKLSFPATELKLETRQESVEAFGVKNIEDGPVTLIIKFQVKDGADFVDFVSEEDLEITSKGANAKIIWDDTLQSLDPGDSKVFPATITAPDKTGNYLYKIILSDENGKEFDSKTFFVKTS